jgi:hypothetical protein
MTAAKRTAMLCASALKKDNGITETLYVTLITQIFTNTGETR